MKLILTADVDNLGAPGDTVEVKDGYGRNYLLPRGLAIVATRGAEKQVEGIRRAQEARAVRGLDHAKELKAAIEGLESVTLTVKTAGGSGKLFGSVTVADVAAAINCRWTRCRQALHRVAEGSHQEHGQARRGREPAPRCGCQVQPERRRRIVDCPSRRAPHTSVCGARRFVSGCGVPPGSVPNRTWG